ncbi:MAG: hypothetical protein V1851_03380 [Patescibacteria group bacterium]
MYCWLTGVICEEWQSGGLVSANMSLCERCRIPGHIGIDLGVTKISSAFVDHFRVVKGEVESGKYKRIKNGD